jgi:hypothetical protein
MKEITLPSGAILKIGNIPFDDSNNLKKAVMREMKLISMDQHRNLLDMYKDILCASFSSEEVEKCLWLCMNRCLYNDLKIEKKTFDPKSAREDFTDVQMEVAVECLTPFTNALWQLLQRMLAMGAGSIQESK